MGLDMYLNKKHYVKNWDHTPEESHHNISITRGGEAPSYINVSKIINVEEEAGYWRKANHIHKWFVDNVQDGEDDCREYWVSPRQLEELHTACKEVLEDTSKAKEVLPTAEGFFFGGTDYDEYYFHDIQRTVDIIKPILADMDQGGHLPYDVYYQSSW